MSGYYPPPGAPPQQFGQPQQPLPGGQGWGAPPAQQFGGHAGQFQQPPQQQWGAPSGGHYPPQGPPPGHQGYNPPPGPPMQQGYYQPPGPPPMQAGYQQPPPPQHGFQQPPPQQIPPQGYGQGSMPSPGYGSQIAQGNANPDVDALMKAMSGFKKDHTTIIRILAKADPLYMALLRQTFAQRSNGATLESKVESFRSHYGDTMLQLVRGPLLSDVHNINRAIKGMGTKEDMLNDVLIGRSNADMQAIKATYQTVFKKTMESDVQGDLSLKTETMFQLIMRASRTEESYPYNPTETSRDSDALYHATRGPSVSTNQDQVFTILTQRSDNQIRAIVGDYQKKYHKSLEDTIRSSFSGHMEDALLLCIGRAMDAAKTDAYGLEDTMKGMGTKDNLLVNRTVRIHWNRGHMDQVKKAYQHFFKKDLIARVKSETSGDYRDALVACLT